MAEVVYLVSERHHLTTIEVTQRLSAKASRGWQMKLSETGLAITLTKSEQKLLSKIPSYQELADSSLDYEEWQRTADDMEALFDSLRKREAIPEVRLRIFADAEYAEKGSKSIKEDFESNGKTGRDIIRHGHFTEYIDYFVNGPILPKRFIERFCELADNDFTQPEELRRFVRQALKEFGLTHYNVPTQIFRLAVERDLSTSTASNLRSEALKSIRRK
ncbi:MAG: hypothetical protein K2Z81_23715 [Cyanobacteria bacterium]|nr:hypothetical protein [Cyanobacteriota bacterium]